MSDHIIEPFVADVFTAMFNQSANTTNAVMDNYERNIADWKKAYAKLWDAVDRANYDHIDSQRLNNILGATEHMRTRAEGTAS